MPITLDLGHIIIGLVMFSILGIMIYAQGRIDEMRKNENHTKAIKTLCALYFDVASEIIGDTEAINRVKAKIKEIENKAGGQQF